jgi:malate dehydrogenase (oxaloacetate-decarboxylating)
MVLRQRTGPARPDPGSLADVSREVLRLASGHDDGGRRPTVLVLSDGSSVLSCGDLGAEAVRPVLERKCEVIERATGMRAFPLAFARAEPVELVRTLELLRSNYDAILIADIAAPRCFELQRLLGDSAVDCPVVHDDQQGTAVMAAAVVLTAVIRSGRTLDDLCAVVVGAGAAGSSTARLLHHLGVGELRVVDSVGILRSDRTDLTPVKAELAVLTDHHGIRGSLGSALRGADLCVALSGSPIAAEDLAGMNAKPIIIPLSYPDIEVRLEDAVALGAEYLPALENNLSNNLATPGLLLAAYQLGLRQPSTRDLQVAVDCLMSMSTNRLDDSPVPSVDPGLLARSIAGAIADGRVGDRGNVRL